MQSTQLPIDNQNISTKPVMQSTQLSIQNENISTDPVTTMVSVLPHECFENGWSAFGTNCYKVIPADDDGINWFDAQKACESLGSNLASIHDQSEQDVHLFSGQVDFVRRQCTWSMDWFE